MAERVTYVNVEADGVFSFHGADGALVEIGSEPIVVDDHSVAYLDDCPFVERAGTVTVADAPEEEPSTWTLQDAPDDPEEA